MRVCGLFAVLLIHVCGFGRRPPLAQDVTGWWICNVASALSQWAVPVFVMLSGALLLDPDRRETWLTFLRKRFVRTGLPLLFWSVFYLRWTNPHGMTPTSWEFLRQGRPYYHLYFLFIIFGLYLLTPPLRILLRFLGDRERGILGGVALGIAAATAYWRPEAEGRTAWTLFLPYVGFYIFGLVLRRRTREPFTLVFALVGWILSSGYVLFGEWVRAAANEPTVGLRYVIQGHFSPVVILESLSVFVLLREAMAQEWQWVRKVAQVSLGIYLIHPFILDELAYVHLDNRWHGPAVGVPITTLVVLVLSFAVAWLIQRVPVLRFINGG